MARLCIFLLILVSCALATTPALACRFALPEVYATDSGLTDDVAPGPTELVDVTVERGGGTGSCNGGNTCGDIATVYVALTAVDDQTATDDIGFVFRLLDGDARYTPPVAPMPAGDGVVTFHVGDDGGGMRYDLEVRAVDRAGNIGPATLIEVRNGTGCAIGGQASSAMPALLALAFLALRHRRR